MALLRYLSFSDLADLADLADLEMLEQLEQEEELTDIKLLQRSMRHRRLKNLIRIVPYNPKVYWPAIFRFLTRNKKFVNQAFVRKYPKRFLSTLLLTGCSDFSLVDRILKMYALQLSKAIDYDNCFQRFSVLKQVCFLDSDVMGTRLFPDVEMIKLALDASDLSFLTALLKYGFCNLPNKIYRDECPLALKMLVDFWYNCMKQHGIEPRYYAKMFEEATTGIRRIYSTIRIIDLLRFKREHSISLNNVDEKDEDRLRDLRVFENRRQCLRLYFRATPEPLISKQDIVQLLCLHFTHIRDDFLQGLTAEYESVFPEECAPSYAPRSLKHLCRIRFRKYVVLKKSGILPEVIGGLRLPKAVKSYLLCSS